MAAVVAVAAGAFAQSAVAGAFVGTAMAGGFLATALAAGAGMIASGLVGSALGDKPASPSSETFDQQARGTLVNSASTVEPIPIVYGSRRVGGPRVFTHINGPNNRFLHLCIIVSEGPISRIGQIYLDGIPLTDARFAGCTLYANRQLGEDSQAAPEGPLSYAPELWTANHRGRGVAYLSLALVYTQAAFPSGLPVVTMDVDGRTLYDPRDAGTRFSHNPALAIFDYRTNTRYGMGLDSTMHDTAGTWTAIANHCEGRETVPTSTADITAVNTADNTLAFADGMTQARLGDGVRLTTTGTLPSPLATATTYYVFREDEIKIKLASSYANALARTAIDLTTTGSGTHTVTHYDRPRYTLEGSVDIDQLPFDNVRDMLSTMFRGSIWASGGLYRIACDKAETPTSFGFDEDNIVGAWQIAGVQKKDKLNRVRARYFNPAMEWKPDIATYENATWRTNDDAGVLLDREISLPFTCNFYIAQALGQLEARDSRYGISVQFRATIEGHRAEVFDVVPLTHTTPGWTAQSMRVRNMRLLSSDEVEVVAREYQDIYTLTAPDLPNFPSTTTLPSYFAMITQAPPRVSGLQIFNQGLSDTTFTGRDLKLVWRKSSHFANQPLAGDQGAAGQGGTDFTFRDYAIEIRTTAGVLLRADSATQPEYTYTWEKNAEDNAGSPVRAFTIDVWQRSRYGKTSTLSAHLAVSNPAPTISGFSTTSMQGGFRFAFTQPSDTDYGGIKVYADVTTGFTPSSSNLVYQGNKINGSVAVANGGLTYAVKYIPYDVFGDGATVETTAATTAAVLSGYYGAANNTAALVMTDSFLSEAVGTYTYDTIGWAPTNGLLYVERSDNKLVVVDPRTRATITTVTIGHGIGAIVFAPNSGYLYVVSSSNTTITVVDPATNTVLTTFTVTAGSAIDACYCPSNGKIYTAQGDIILPLTNASGGQIGTPPAGGDGTAVAYCPYDNTIYLGNAGNLNVITPSTGVTAATIADGFLSAPIVFSPVNNRLYVIRNLSGYTDVVPINPVTRALGVDIDNGTKPEWLVYVPANNKLYVFFDGYAAPLDQDSATIWTMVATTGTATGKATLAPNAERVFVTTQSATHSMIAALAF